MVRRHVFSPPRYAVDTHSTSSDRHAHALCHCEGPTLRAQLQLEHRAAKDGLSETQAQPQTARQEVTIHTVNEVPKGPPWWGKQGPPPPTAPRAAHPSQHRGAGHSCCGGGSWTSWSRKRSGGRAPSAQGVLACHLKASATASAAAVRPAHRRYRLGAPGEANPEGGVSASNRRAERGK